MQLHREYKKFVVKSEEEKTNFNILLLNFLCHLHFWGNIFQVKNFKMNLTMMHKHRERDSDFPSKSNMLQWIYISNKTIKNF